MEGERLETRDCETVKTAEKHAMEEAVAALMTQLAEAMERGGGDGVAADQEAHQHLDECLQLGSAGANRQRMLRSGVQMEVRRRQSREAGGIRWAGREGEDAGSPGEGVGWGVDEPVIGTRRIRGKWVLVTDGEGSEEDERGVFKGVIRITTCSTMQVHQSAPPHVASRGQPS